MVDYYIVNDYYNVLTLILLVIFMNLEYSYKELFKKFKYRRVVASLNSVVQIARRQVIHYCNCYSDFMDREMPLNTFTTLPYFIPMSSLLTPSVFIQGTQFSIYNMDLDRRSRVCNALTFTEGSKDVCFFKINKI